MSAFPGEQRKEQTTVKGSLGKKGAINVTVFGMMVVIWGFAKLIGFTSETSDVFC